LNRLLAYQAVLYDANIIIYYCFYCPLRLSRDVESVVDLGELTESVRRISDRLRSEGRKIRTIRAIIDEISETLLADIVRRRVCDEEVRETVGLVRGDPFPPLLELQILEKCRKSVRKVQSSNWFYVDEFIAAAPELAALRQFFRNAANDPAIHARFSRSKGIIPSEPDLHLMAYSRNSRLPVLTDDGHFIILRTGLEALALVTEVVPVRSVVSIGQP